MGVTTRQLQRSTRNLSSGDAIHSSADNTAAMAVKTDLRSSLTSRRQALRNAHEAVNMLQIAESGIDALGELFTRGRELSVQAANDSLSKRERIHVDTEFQDVLRQIDRVFKRTEYNGQNLLDDGSGSYNPEQRTFQVGTGTSTDDRVTLTMKFGLVKNRFDTANLASTLNLRVQSNAQENIELFDRQMVELDRNRTRLGSTMNRLFSTTEHLGSAIMNEGHSLSQISDTDMGAESSRLARHQVMQNAGVAMLSQATSNPQAALRLLG